jgi:DNA-binding transcriptional MocR family regulator
MYGLPDPALFPRTDLAAVAVRVLSDDRMASTALQYGSAQGYMPLIELLIEKLSKDEGLDVSPSNVLITSGSSAAIGLAARTLLDEGDAALVEAPSFPGALNILKRVGAELVAVPIGPEGLDLSATEAMLDDLHARGIHPRLLYTIPTFHNPTGLTMSHAGREALMALARRHDLMIIEDDAYRDLYYDVEQGPLPSSLYALDEDGRVIRTGTFSKILAPGLRLGWALAHPQVTGRMALLKEEGGTNPFAQHIVAGYMREGRLEPHIASLVEAYRAKRDAMLAALDRYMPEGVEWTRPAGGFFVWLGVPASIDPAGLAASAHRLGVDYLAGERCFAGLPHPTAQTPTYLRLSFSMLAPDRIEEAIRRLAEAISEQAEQARLNPARTPA